MPRNRTLDSDDVDPELVSRIQIGVRDWLRMHYGHVPAAAIISALTFEIARTVHASTRITGRRLSDSDVAGLVFGVGQVMESQIRAHRDGHLDPEA